MSIETVKLSAASGATADVAVGLGMNCYSWRTPFAGEASGEARELLWAEAGFPSAETRPSRSGTPLLSPFPGRIAGGVFEWEGDRYELEADDGLGNAIHGFALRLPWRVTERRDDAVTAEFRHSTDAGGAAWPSDYLLTATYTLSDHGMRFDFAAENAGDATLPFGFGTHAYFRLPLAEGSDPEATVVTAPVDAEWASEGLIPTGESTPVASDAPLPAGAPLASREFDTPFRFAPGASVTELADPSTGRRVRQSFDRSMTCCVIYTPDHREAICLEPYTCLPNPIALEASGVPTGLIRLAPGERYATRVMLEALGPETA